jgi:beta-galactosidase/beta-glucuronidase
LPDTGEVTACPFYEQAEGVTRLPLRLSPFGSVFVVFRRLADTPSTVTRGADAPTKAWPVDGPWQVSFSPGWGAPASRTFPQLISWTQDSDEGVKYFSGVGAYHKTLNLVPEQLQAGQRLVLDLGRVRLVADVYLNGRSVGILWKPPFTVDITDAAKAGANELVVEVANTWSNRLAGDAKSEGRDFCRTNIAKSLTWTVPWTETPLLESGLLGPVRLTAFRTQ